jgi:hypothetical protein
MLGKLLADGGGANRIADTLIAKFGPKHVQWAIGKPNLSGDTFARLAIVNTNGINKTKPTSKNNGGGANRIADTLIAKFGPKHVQWAMLVAAFIVGMCGGKKPCVTDKAVTIGKPNLSGDTFARLAIVNTNGINKTKPSITIWNHHCNSSNDYCWTCI